MSGCTESGKPLISIVMAVYHPRVDWLIEQLDSLNTQTYPNLELIICDDGPDAPVEERVFARHITAFPWRLVRNEQNCGSNRTFERLTELAGGEYIAYCDQDDIWLSQKLNCLYERIQETQALLVCSDVSLMDAESKVFAQGIASARPRHIFHEGLDTAVGLIYRNFAIGCTMLVVAAMARMAVPFAAYMVHDHYLAFFCAMHGEIAVCPGYLVQYRLHKGNQTGILAHISNKVEYEQQHLEPFYLRVIELQMRFVLPELEVAAAWALARKENAARMPKGARKLWRLRHINYATTLFEIVGLRLPRPLFALALQVIQSGKI